MRLANLPFLPVAGLGLAVSAASALAQSYVGSAYEGFDYTAGATIDGALSGGTGWNSTGDSSLANTTSWATGVAPAAQGTGRTINATGLDYANPLYASDIGGEKGLAASITGVPGASQVPRSIGQDVGSGTLYFSFLTQKTVDTLRTLNFSFFGTTATPGTYNERLAIGQIGANTNLVGPIAGTANSGAFVALVSNSQNPVANGGTGINGVYSAATPVSYTLGETFLVTGKFDFNYSGVLDRLSLYINPSDLTDESSLTPYLVVDNNDFGTLGMFRMFSGATGGGFNASGGVFDEIRFGAAFTDVTGAAIPEPGTYAAMAGLVGLAFAVLRRRVRR